MAVYIVHSRHCTHTSTVVGSSHSVLFLFINVAERVSVCVFPQGTVRMGQSEWTLCCVGYHWLCVLAVYTICVCVCVCVDWLAGFSIGFSGRCFCAEVFVGMVGRGIWANHQKYEFYCAFPSCFVDVFGVLLVSVCARPFVVSALV